MQKLIKLLNECHHFNSDLIYYGWDEECEKFYFHTELPEKTKKELGDALIGDGINEQRVCNERICSKKFGFIQRLVENDKINFSKLNPIHLRKGLNVLIEQELFEDLIMLLSVQDEPIKFLNSVLK